MPAMPHGQIDPRYPMACRDAVFRIRIQLGILHTVLIAVSALAVVRNVIHRSGHPAGNLCIPDDPRVRCVCVDYRKVN